MLYTALQVGADGLLFWTYYRSDPSWVRDVLVPLVAEVQPIRQAVAAGPVYGLVSSARSDVVPAVYADPSTGNHYVVTVHHGSGTVEAPLTLQNSLAATTSAKLLGSPSSDVAVTGGQLQQVIGPYQVKVYRID